MRRVALCLTVALLASGCTAIDYTRGYVPDTEALSSIKVGMDTKQTVTQKLGDPSAAATFNTDTWYYISSHDVQKAFFAAHSTTRSIVAVQFAANGQVSNIQHYGLQDGRVVDYVARETPTPGRELTFLQQIFNAIPGNIGAPGGSQNPDQNPGGGGGAPP